MEEHSDILVYAVIVVAFLIGYSIVSFVIRHLKELRNMPPLNEEIWKHPSDTENERGHIQEVFRSQGQKSHWDKHEETEREANWQAEEEERYSKEQKGRHREETSTKRTVKNEAYFESVLGLQYGMTPEDIKGRYWELVTQYHPDIVAHFGPKLREVASQEIREINEAYDFFKKKYGLS